MYKALTYCTCSSLYTLVIHAYTTSFYHCVLTSQLPYVKPISRWKSKTKTGRRGQQNNLPHWGFAPDLCSPISWISLTNLSIARWDSFVILCSVFVHYFPSRRWRLVEFNASLPVAVQVRWCKQHFIESDIFKDVLPSVFFLHLISSKFCFNWNNANFCQGRRTNILNIFVRSLI